MNWRERKKWQRVHYPHTGPRTQTRVCPVCGDSFGPAEYSGRLPGCTLEGIAVLATHCRECGEEIVFGVIPALENLNSCGRGCPLDAYDRRDF